MEAIDEVSTADISSEDVAETIRLLKEIPALSSNVSDAIQGVMGRITKGELETSKGLSFLELKNYTMLNYLMNLTHIITLKLSGKKIENDPAIDRLIESRIVLEKMKPIDEKLKYQINKLQSAVTHGKIDESDPLRFRANPENLNAEDEDEDEEQEDRKDSNVYVPPKISAAYYDEDELLKERQQKILDRSKKRALSSTVLYELRKEHETKPEEVKETVDPYRIKLNEAMSERERYEEEYMTRLPMTKKQRHEARQLTTVSNFNTRLGSISGLDLGTDDAPLKRRSGGKKGRFSKKFGKGKGKKRKH